MKTKTMKTLTLLISVMFAGHSAARAAITVVNAAGANHVPLSICPAIDGGNELVPDPPTYLSPPAAGAAVLTELAGGDSPFAGWTFNSGAALNGTLTINYYISTFDAAHYSGANIKATYARGEGDPATLRWLQMVETTAPKGGASSPYIDPYPNDDPTNAPLPFYWTERESQKYGLTFYDASRRSHPPTSFITWRGHLYLSSWDGKTPGTVTLHDGVKWGFDAGCLNTNHQVDLRIAVKFTGDLELTWDTNAGALPTWVQTTTLLGDPLAWTDLDQPISRSDGVFHMTVPRPEEARFFRVSSINTNPPNLFEPAYIRVQPLSETVTQGWGLSLSVKAGGDEPIAYQWYQGSGAIPGATQRELTIPHTQFSHEGSYSVSVSNATGSQLSQPAHLSIVPDTTPPNFASASASPDLMQILLTFTEPVHPVSVLNPSFYQVFRVQPPGTVQIVNVQPTPDPATVALQPAPGSPLTPGSFYELRMVNGGCDFAAPPNCLPPGSVISFETSSP